VIATDPAAALDRLGDPTALRSCVLVIHHEPETVMTTARDLACDRGWIEIPIGRDLSAALLNVPVKQRSRHARQWLHDRLTNLAPNTVVFTGIDLLFEPSLELNPLALLRQMSRLAPVIAAWPGSVNAHGLSYGTPPSV
jgi:hypothetical protein